MNSFTDDPQFLLEHQRQQLETIFYQTIEHPINRPTRIQRFIHFIGQAVGAWLISNKTPRIHRLIRGKTEVWKVYDPICHRTYYFPTEHDVRVWIEQRYGRP